MSKKLEAIFTVAGIILAFGKEKNGEKFREELLVRKEKVEGGTVD